LAGDGGLVEALHPALGRVDRGALLGGLQQGVSVLAASAGNPVHAGLHPDDADLVLAQSVVAF